MHLLETAQAHEQTQLYPPYSIREQKQSGLKRTQCCKCFWSRAEVWATMQVTDSRHVTCIGLLSTHMRKFQWHVVHKHVFKDAEECTAPSQHIPWGCIWEVLVNIAPWWDDFTILRMHSCTKAQSLCHNDSSNRQGTCRFCAFVKMVPRAINLKMQPFLADFRHTSC